MLSHPTRLRELQHHLLGAYDAPVKPEFLVHENFSDSAYTTWYIRKGAIRVESEGKSLNATAGNWVFFDPFVLRSHYLEPGTQLLSIRVQVEWRGVYSIPPVQSMRVLKSSWVPRLLEAGTNLVKTLEQLNESHPTLHSDCAFEAAFLHWLAEWHKVRAEQAESEDFETHVSDPRIHQILSFLSGRPGLGVIDYTALERHVGLSRSQIDRLCRTQIGLTPRQWCERRTLAMAQHWLASSRVSIKEIAHRLDFVDASHFGKWLRRQTGQSPRQARGYGGSGPG
jgi:AraC-like DNA-binding protein